MMRLAWVLLLLSGCVGLRPDAATACRVVHEKRQYFRPFPGSNAARLHPKDLRDLALGTPFETAAKSAWDQRLTAQVLGGIGAAALVTGFVMGFAIDPTQPDARNAGYGIIGGAIGMGALSMTLAATGSRLGGKTERSLYNWSEQCE
jgi:hypothetical protein